MVAGSSRLRHQTHQGLCDCYVDRWLAQWMGIQEQGVKIPLALEKGKILIQHSQFN